MNESYVEAYRQSQDMQAIGLTKKPPIGKVAEGMALLRILTPRPKALLQSSYELPHRQTAAESNYVDVRRFHFNGAV